MTEKIKVKIIKSEIPIIWVDTSIITLMTQWKHELCKLDTIKKERISGLYNAIYDNTRKGRLICPLAEQEGEVWVERDKWLDTINTLSLGIDVLSLKEIQDNQLYIFMKAFLENEDEVTLSYNDAFHEDPVDELRDILSKPVFITVNMPILFGEDYQKNLKKKMLQALNEQREKNVKLKVNFEEQLKKEYIGEIEALLFLKQQFLSGKFKDYDEEFNATYGTIDLNNQLMMWQTLSGKSTDYNGLILFYKSSHHHAMPYTNISCNLIAHLMTDKQPIRSGDMMDIKHASTIMPFSKIFITDKAMSNFLRKKEFDKLYSTTVCYIGETQIIDEFFSKL